MFDGSHQQHIPFGVQASEPMPDVEIWRSMMPEYPDYEVSDMGRIRCIKDRRGTKAPFFPAVTMRSQRPVVLLRRSDMRQETRRVDEIVLSTFVGPRPTPDAGAMPTNGDRSDVRADNLHWAAGAVLPAHQKRKPRRKKPVKQAQAKISNEIKHGHWLGVGNTCVSIQPNGSIELTVAEPLESVDHHCIPLKDLDDVIRVLQAAKTIIEG
jgi:hypothetical protein